MGRLVAAVLEDRHGAGLLTLRFRVAVNATGPWLDRIRRLADPRSRPIARLSKGVHAVLPAPDGWRAGLAVSLSGNRASFALPWHGMLLVGVTDTPYDGDPAGPAVTPEDLGEVLGGLAPVLPAGLLRFERVLNSFVGLRVLPIGAGDTHNAAREHVVDVGPTGLVSVGGGKLTTHRWIARAALERLPRELRPRLRAADEPIVRAGRADAPVFGDLDADLRTHLLSLYGADAEDVVRLGLDVPGGLERMHPEAPDVWAQALYAVEREWAIGPADVARRTTLAVRGVLPPLRELPGGRFPGSPVHAVGDEQAKRSADGLWPA